MITVDFSRLNIQPGFRILDIGCGTGRHTCAAYQCRNVTAIGVDHSFDDLREAKKRLNYHDALGVHGGGGWELSAADIHCLPFENNSFDLVICSEVLEHIPDHRAAIKEVVRVLKAGCDLIVSVPRYWPERFCWALSNSYCNSDGGHVRIYRQNDLIGLIEDAGVKRWALHYAHSLHTPFWWLKCLLGPDRDDSKLVNLYHRFLTWDIMKRPVILRALDRLFNPLLGKSLVIYFRKGFREPSRTDCGAAPLTT